MFKDFVSYKPVEGLISNLKDLELKNDPRSQKARGMFVDVSAPLVSYLNSSRLALPRGLNLTSETGNEYNSIRVLQEEQLMHFPLIENNTGYTHKVHLSLGNELPINNDQLVVLFTYNTTTTLEKYLEINDALRRHGVDQNLLASEDAIRSWDADFIEQKFGLLSSVLFTQLLQFAPENYSADDWFPGSPHIQLYSKQIAPLLGGADYKASVTFKRMEYERASNNESFFVSLYNNEVQRAILLNNFYKWSRLYLIQKGSTVGRKSEIQSKLNHSPAEA